MSANDDDNPIITCTVMQLAFVAWQKRHHSDDITPSGWGWNGFRAWWDERAEAGFASIREACWKAWAAAVPRHGDGERFEAWWATVLAARPEVS